MEDLGNAVSQVLGDAASFFGCRVSFPDIIKKRGFTMVYVAHNNNDWRASGLIIFG
jgi:hypothetical protein